MTSVFPPSLFSLTFVLAWAILGAAIWTLAVICSMGPTTDKFRQMPSQSLLGLITGASTGTMVLCIIVVIKACFMQAMPWATGN